VDVLAFFVFFMFKGEFDFPFSVGVTTGKSQRPAYFPTLPNLCLGWKRLLLAEFPRQLLNALTLYDIIERVADLNESNYFLRYYNAIKKLVENGQSSTLTLIAYALSTFTVLMWFLGFMGLLGAFFVYIPLIFNIRGNLKEYCCHKIDKR
jgi:hypothetical protein